MWLTIAKYAFQVAILAVSKISPAQWAQLGTIIQTWLQAIEDKLPAGHPLITMTSSFRASRAKLQAPKPDAEKWES